MASKLCAVTDQESVSVTPTPQSIDGSHKQMRQRSSLSHARMRKSYGQQEVEHLARWMWTVTELVVTSDKKKDTNSNAKFVRVFGKRAFATEQCSSPGQTAHRLLLECAKLLVAGRAAGPGANCHVVMT